jgi:hypothetical protein
LASSVGKEFAAVKVVMVARQNNVRACEDLLSDAITRDTMTSKELEILEVNLDNVSEKFFP